MSYADFLKVDIAAFEEIANAHYQHEETKSRESWEQTRKLATLILQPYAKKGHKINPTDVLPLPWDNEQPEQPKAPKMTVKEQRERMRHLAETQGLQMI